jgi:DNA-binding transcriptional MerR regulator
MNGGVAKLDGEDRGWEYRIGTVANLTGVPSHTIRAWERRHGAIEPSRSEGGTRLYSDRHVARLQLLKAVTDLGQPIGSLAGLSDEDLRERLARRAAPRERGETAPRVEARPRLAFLGPHLVAQLRANAAGMASLDLGPRESDLESFVAAVRQQPADVLVISLEALGDEPARALDACRESAGASLVLVVYDFAPRRRLAQLAAKGAKLLHGPLSLAALERSVLDLLSVRELPGSGKDDLEVLAPLAAESAPPAERLFSEEGLARLREVPSALACECPAQVSAIVTQLVAFERYAKQCESRDAADAALHAGLARVTGHARALMERLLVRICEHDQIRI